MPIIEILIRGKVASRKSDTVPYIVSGNSDYVARFDFDAEWGGYATKTARFVYGGGYTDVIFDGDTCPVPVMNCGGVCEIGVYAGDIRTSTAASLPILGSVTLGGEPNEAPAPDVYNEIMERLNKLDGSGIDTKANVGDTIVVKSVDENGKAAEFEAAEYQPRTHYVDEKGEVHKLDNKFIDAEWMATDGIGEGAITVFPKQTISSSIIQRRQYDLQPGLEYAVIIDGVLYPCVAHSDGERAVYLGNPTIADSSSKLSHNNEPFYIYWAGGSATAAMFFKDSSLKYPLSVKVTDLSHSVPQKLPEKFLPTGVVKSVNGVSPDENGNVSVSGVSGGSSGTSIDVVASVGQTIVVTAVDSSGKPTAWEAADYQTRTHWDEEVEFMAESNFTLTEEEEGIYTYTDDAYTGELFKKGCSYKVLWNGVEYLCDPIVFGTETYLGNLDALEGTGDSGEPFLIITVNDGEVGIFGILALDGSTAVNVKIDEIQTTPIAKRYLTETAPYYIDIISDETDETYYCVDSVSDIEAIIDSERELYARICDYDDEGSLNMEVYCPLTMRVKTGDLGYQLFFVAIGSSSGLVTVVLEPNEDGMYNVTLG